MQILSRGNLDVHFLILENCWRNNYDVVQEAVLSAKLFLAKTLEQSLDSPERSFFLAGLFIRFDYRGRGCGKLSLNKIKSDTHLFFNAGFMSTIQEQRGFTNAKKIIVEKTWERENNNNPEHVMEWRKEET